MSLLDIIKQDQFEARKNKEATKASLLTTLFSEATMVGKNNGNRTTTDEEVVKVIQKFLKGVNETIAVLNSFDPRLEIANLEKTLLENYLPKMATEEEVRAEVARIKAEGTVVMGAIMKSLKEKFGSALDGKMASLLAKE